MKLHKITFTLTLLGILILIFLTQKPQIQSGTIKSIQTSQFKTIIQLENQEVELILFDPISTTLKKGDIVNFQGRPDTYKGKKQIIVDKIFIT